MPKQIDILKHGPYYPGTRKLLDDGDMSLPRELFEAAIFLNASFFTTTRFVGRSQDQKYSSPYDKRQFATYEEALIDAGDDSTAIVWVVSKRGRSFSVNPADRETYRKLQRLV